MRVLHLPLPGCIHDTGIEAHLHEELKSQFRVLVFREWEAMVRAEELEVFKREIDLVEYAAAELGFRVDQQSRASARLKREGDIIIVARDRDGHYTYFSPLEDSDNGTIIDLLQKRRGLSLGEVRKELRGWLGKLTNDATSSSLASASHEFSDQDRLRLKKRLQFLRVASDHPYLRTRGIPPEVLASDRFAGRILLDHRQNALFPHEDEQGLCGFEIRGPEYKGFSRGEKGLWHSNRSPSDHTLVITESAINALSYHAIHHPQHTQYASTAGGWGVRTGMLILRSAQLLNHPATVILAFDNDEQGRRYTTKARELFRESDVEVIDALPEVEGRDWNDLLRERG
jgi:hypothetical protein